MMHDVRTLHWQTRFRVSKNRKKTEETRDYELKAGSLVLGCERIEMHPWSRRQGRRYKRPHLGNEP
jgi:hypothetical protein